MTSLDSALQTNFGFSSFRPGQAEAVQSLLSGRHTLAVMPTGAGKSLIFQLAALLIGSGSKPAPTTLVISPLIALMKDQVDSLNCRNIPATFINSTLPAFEQTNRLQKLSDGKYRLLYVAPERLRSTSFLKALRHQPICLLAVDEAHCISEWGHDFRPDYLNIAQARVTLGNPLTAALTATATPKVQKDILRLLGLEGACSLIVTGFNRPNLNLNVRYTNGLASKLRVLSELLSTRQSGATIVYTGTRRDAEEVAEFARTIIRIPAEHYHAGLLAGERKSIQEAFVRGKINLIVATNAFGMGIDRADVRQVIHYSLPGSLEAYYQEAGRAGRDGLPASVTLLYDPQDRSLHEFFIQQSELTSGNLSLIYKALPTGKEIWSTLDKLSLQTGLHPVQIKVGLSALERVGILDHLGDNGQRMMYRRKAWNAGAIGTAIQHSNQHIKNRQRQLDGIVRYAESNDCRRGIILRHFGDQDLTQAVECCDNCRSAKSAPAPNGAVVQSNPVDSLALIILDCIRCAKTKVGREKMAQILHGSKAKDILKFRHDKNIYYASLAKITQNTIQGLIKQLVEQGYIKVIGGKYPVLSLTPQGINAIENKEIIHLKLPKYFNAAKKQPTASKKDSEKRIKHIVELGESKSPEAVPELVSALDNPNGNIRRLAASALGKIGHRQAVDPLLKLLERESKPQVRQYAVKALGRIADQRAIVCLRKIAIDECERYYVRDSARYALKKILNSKEHTKHKAPASDSPILETSLNDPIESFLSTSHPRPLLGPWQYGWSLGYHSRFSGGDWSRSKVGDLTYRLKYNCDTSVLPALVELTLALLKSQPAIGKMDIIVPVPASTERKINPVQAFCEALAAKLNRPVYTLVTKTRTTNPQKEMKTFAQKRSNVAGAFNLNGEARNKHILLVDDLFDSGATLEEITHLLLRSGAVRVNVLTLTRSIHTDT
jgi:ATP-dependent DNA helicase RecQ